MKKPTASTKIIRYEPPKGEYFSSSLYHTAFAIGIDKKGNRINYGIKYSKFDEQPYDIRVSPDERYNLQLLATSKLRVHLFENDQIIHTTFDNGAELWAPCVDFRIHSIEEYTDDGKVTRYTPMCVVFTGGGLTDEDDSSLPLFSYIPLQCVDRVYHKDVEEGSFTDHYPLAVLLNELLPCNRV